MTQENLAVGSLPTPAFLRLLDDNHVSDENLALSHPPAPGQCITTLCANSPDVSDSDLALSHPPAPGQCITTLCANSPELSDSNLALSHPPAPGQCITTLCANSPDISDSNLALSHPPAPGQCITTLQPEMIGPVPSVDTADRDGSIDLNLTPFPTPPSLCFRPGKDELAVQFDDLDLSAPPPGFHTQSCSCGLGCVSPVAQQSEFSDSDLTLSAPLPGGPKPCYSACGVF